MAKIKVTNPKQIINGGAKKYYFKVKGLGGPKGDKGDKGDTGSQGPQGPQGNAATIMVGSTTTLPTGYDATVTNTGTINNAILNFGIPRGIKGDTGAKGDKGDKGDKGEQGNAGPQGPAGQNATVYVGTTTTGAAGTQASVYNSGTDRNAVLNFTIPQGAKGDTGATGATGPQGPAGQDGQNFTPTVVDSLPATGDQSKLYLTPKNYTTGTATGNPITISLGEDAGQITSAQLDGDTAQQSYTGQNLYNVATLQTSTYVTKDDDGWITITRDNTSGSSATYTNAWTSNLALETNTQYAIFLEIKEASGTGEFDITSTNSTQGQFTSWQSKQIANLAAGQVYRFNPTTKSSFSGIFGGLRTLLNLSAGQSASITFRLSVLADTSVTTSSFVYEPYVGGQPSPSPDYPQQIQTVTGRQTVTVTGKNKINMPYRESKWDGASVLQNGTTLTMKPNSTSGMSMSYSTPAIPVAIPAGETITWSRIWLGGTWNSGAFTFPLEITYSDGTTETISLGYTTENNYLVAASRSVTLAKDVVSVRLLYALCYSIKEMTGDIVFGVQLELGSTPTAYTAYSKQTYPIDLGSIELCKLGTYQDYIWKDGSDWKVHKATATTTLDGSEAWYNAGGNAPFGLAIDGALITTSDANPPLVYCDKFYPVSQDASWSSYDSLISTNNINSSTKTIRIRYVTIASLSAFQTWLGNNNTALYYALATATDTTITDQTLIAQLEAIRTASLQSSNTITNTATGTNLAGDLELGYCEYDPQNRYDKWLWLDLNNNYEKLGS